jgi:Ca-activated chloride channel family protein
MKQFPMPVRWIALATLFFVPLIVLAQNPQVPQQDKQQKQQKQVQQAQQAEAVLNAVQNRAAPTMVGDPQPFASTDGKDGKIKGWKLLIPGNRPLATPAVVDGKLFIGGGFGSHEFYAFDATTGKKVWQYQTGDDGPTAAVVEGGYIAFNTESCELEILTVDGKPVWKKWLGDPLMSMPAISKDKVYMAYPNSKGDRQHYLACFELKTGKEFWKKPIAGEIITAPIVTDEKVYLSTLEGTVYCFGQHDGELVWKEKKNATSAPLIWNGKCYFGQRVEVTVKKDGKEYKQQNEQLAGRAAATKEAPVVALPATARVADDLDYKKNEAKPLERAQKLQDATVGFAAAPADAKLGQAMQNLGKGSVCGVWSYQGSKPFIYDGKMYSSMGDTLKCVDPKTEKVLWEKKLHEVSDKDKDKVDSLTTPPALVNGKAFVGTTSGEVFCLSADKGEVLWKVSVGAAVLFQPAVAKGRVYVSTNNGGLFCLETGDSKDDGWQMWGANAGHNGGK